MILLSNRIFRLITGVVVEVAFFVGFYFACGWATGDYSSLIMMPMLAVLLGLVGQILYDLLDIGFLNEMVGRIIKRVVFYAATVFLLIVLFTGILGPDNGGAGIESITAKYGALSGAFAGAAGFSFGVVAAIVTALSRDDTNDARRCTLPFAGVIGLLGSLLLGLLFSFICKDYHTLILVSAIVSIVLLVLFTLLFGLPFDYDDVGFNLISKIMPHRKSKSYSGGGSSRSSSSGSSRSSSSSGSYSSGSSSYTPTDGRKNDLIGNLGLEMNSVASNASRYYSLAYGVGVNLNVRYATYGGKIVFTVSGRLSGTDRIKDQYEANSVTSELQSVLQSVANDLVSNASHRIDTLRTEYKNFDRAYSIDVKMGDIR